MHRRYSVKRRFNESFVSREQSSYQSLFAEESQQLSQHDQIVGRKELTDRRRGGNMNLNLKKNSYKSWLLSMQRRRVTAHTQEETDKKEERFTQLNGSNC